jgi:hypothetical protein
MLMINRTWFIVDVITAFPIEIFYSENKLGLKLIRLMRLPRIINVFSEEKFENFIDQVISKRKIVFIMKIRIIYKVFRLFFLVISVTYTVSAMWICICEDVLPINKYTNFLTTFNIDRNHKSSYRLLIGFYYTLSTLSTIGYGDIIPVNSNERIVVFLIMLIGVALYAYIIGSFTNILTQYRKIIDEREESMYLQQWIMLLGKFYQNKNMKDNVEINYEFDKELINKIDLHYLNFWKNDRNNEIKKNGPHLIACPKSLRIKMINYIWSDVFYKFKNFFLYHEKNSKDFSRFYYNISFNLLPRM